MAAAEGYQMEAAVLAAPVVKDREVLRLRRDAAGRRDVTGLVRTIVAAAPPPDSTTRTAAAGAFNVIDLGEVARLFAAWWRGLRGVRPYYAVKCNPNPALLGALAGLGAGFDCASRAEMEAVLALGVAADRVVYANPCKLEPHLEYAAGVGVDLTTFDSEEEVGKIKRCHPGCRLLLRIKAPDGDDGGGAMLNLGTKYGAHRDEVVPLLAAARRAGMAVVGVPFHAGSAVSRVGIYAAAIEAARVRRRRRARHAAHARARHRRGIQGRRRRRRIHVPGGKRRDQRGPREALRWRRHAQRRRGDSRAGALLRRDGVRARRPHLREAHARRGARVLDRRRHVRHPVLRALRELRAAPGAGDRHRRRRRRAGGDHGRRDDDHVDEHVDEDAPVDGVRPHAGLVRRGGEGLSAAGAVHRGLAGVRRRRRVHHRVQLRLQRVLHVQHEDLPRLLLLDHWESAT
uniref:ornithine decarboxylase n=1 Tax=Oryza sativa subsp. japonica TaxID=39947 RepID=Q5U9M2_ORYSJ|nr:ornithine decarboxylase [Oryza sativa Japonica Group]